MGHVWMHPTVKDLLYCHLLTQDSHNFNAEERRNLCIQSFEDLNISVSVGILGVMSAVLIFLNSDYLCKQAHLFLE